MCASLRGCEAADDGRELRKASFLPRISLLSPLLVVVALLWWVVEKLIC
jgi:hypothetical protein